MDLSDEQEFSDFELGFLKGVFASRGYTVPNEEQFREALELLDLHNASIDGEAN